VKIVVSAGKLLHKLMTLAVGQQHAQYKDNMKYSIYDAIRYHNMKQIQYLRSTYVVRPFWVSRFPPRLSSTICLGRQSSRIRDTGFSSSQMTFPVTQSLARALKKMQSNDPNQCNGRSLLYQSITGLITKGSWQYLAPTNRSSSSGGHRPDRGSSRKRISNHKMRAILR